MDENLYLSQLTIGESCALMMEFRGQPVEEITRSSKLNSPEPAVRKAARTGYSAWRNSMTKEDWQAVLDDRKERKRQATVAYNLKLAEDRKAAIVQRQVFLEKQCKEEAAEKAALKAKNAQQRQAKNLLSKLLPVDRRTGGQREMQLKALPVKCFVPHIGNVNAEGQTPVQIDARTKILVGPGKDLQKVIAAYQKILNLKSA